MQHSARGSVCPASPHLGSFLDRTEAWLLQTKHNHAARPATQLEVPTVFTAQAQSRTKQVHVLGSPTPHAGEAERGSVAVAQPLQATAAHLPSYGLFSRTLNNEIHSSEGTAHSKACKHDFATWIQSGRRCWKLLSARAVSSPPPPGCTP